MIDVQNGHQFVGILGLTLKCGARRTIVRSPTWVGSIKNRGRDRNRARPRENEMAPRRDLH